MHFPKYLLVFATVCLSTICNGQDRKINIFSQPIDGTVKTENNLFFSWHVQQTDESNDVVKVFDANGAHITEFRVLPAVPDAKGAVVFDVSGIDGKWIAVAAAFS